MPESRLRILVVDDEPDLVLLLSDILANAGFEVATARSAAEADQRIRDQKPALIFLDLKLPGLDGREYCRRLKSDSATSAIPIVILTGRYLKPDDRVAGLELGADDYLLKPFYPKEIVARVRAILRRVKPLVPGEMLRDDALIVDTTAHRVTVKGKVVELTPKEFGLLYTLVKHRGEVLNRPTLMEQVWGAEYFGTTRTVDVHVAHLRHKLGPLGERLRTVETVGYAWGP